VVEDAMSNRTLFLIDGANELRGPRALWWVVRRWPALRRELTGADGYVAHRLWYALPFTVGLTTWWTEERLARRFAHMPVHLEFWKWANRTGATTGGWLATYRYESGGPLWGNGVDAMMKRFGSFVDPPSKEPPRPAPADRRADRE
jgi:hypothetical protein